VADVTRVYKLLHGEEDTACGYTGADKREELQDVDAVRAVESVS
jgi:hypothetical protein